MDMAENAFLALSAFGMLLGIVFGVLPVIPGSVVVWAIAAIAGAITQFERVTVGAVLIITVIMIVQVTSDWWLPVLGVRTSGLTCPAALGSMVGGIIGTFVLPIPILNTLIGTVAGALVVDYFFRRRRKLAIEAGKSAFKLFIVSFILEGIASIMMLCIFLFSAFSTAA
jgi:uncharacterized protein